MAAKRRAHGNRQGQSAAATGKKIKFGSSSNGEFENSAEILRRTNHDVRARISAARLEISL